MPVQKKAIITGPFPTREEIIEFYQIPPRRVAELDRMIAEIRATSDRANRVRVKPSTSAIRKRNAARPAKKK
jgi:hypothetical protein